MCRVDANSLPPVETVTMRLGDAAKRCEILLVSKGSQYVGFATGASE